MTYEVIVPQWGDVKEMQNESTASQMKSKRRAKGIPKLTDWMKQKQIYEPRYSKRNNSNNNL